MSSVSCVHHETCSEARHGTTVVFVHCLGVRQRRWTGWPLRSKLAYGAACVDLFSLKPNEQGSGRRSALSRGLALQNDCDLRVASRTSSRQAACGAMRGSTRASLSCPACSKQPGNFPAQSICGKRLG
jgi:hypothetical protein